MTMPKFTSYMISQQPDQTAYLLNKLAEGRGGGGDGTLYDTTGQNTDGAMTQKATTNAIATKADALAVGQALAGKVDKETGKGLSSNDFTNEELEKLNGIQAGAEVNVQSDWDQTDNTADDYIKNKPTIPAGAVLYNGTGQNTDGAMTQKASTDLFNVAAYIDVGTIGSPTPWIQTSDIVDRAVTPEKISRQFFTIADATNLSVNNIDLNSTTYCEVGKYYCNTATVGSTQSNNPSGSAYQMWVINMWGGQLGLTGAWAYIGRIMWALNGVWFQVNHTDGDGNPSYGTWRQLHNA